MGTKKRRNGVGEQNPEKLARIMGTPEVERWGEFGGRSGSAQWYCGLKDIEVDENRVVI